MARKVKTMWNNGNLSSAERMHREHRSKKGRDPRYRHKKESRIKRMLKNKKTVRYDEREINSEINNL